ncbi:MAG: DHH family phosphoesterase [Oscillospiraceae bacterium]|nr:DHH family phosphoesterase [Oscillospiraceae bacterium]
MKGKYSIAIYVLFAVVALCGVASSVLLYMSPQNETLGAILLAIAVFSAIGLTVLLFIASRRYVRNVSKFAKSLTTSQRDSLYNFPAPAVIINDNDEIVWTNMLFDKMVLDGNEPFGKKISEIFEFDLGKILSEKGSLVHVNDKFYRVHGLVNETNDGKLTLLYLNDITKMVELEFEYNQSRQTVMMITIDNYDELLQNAKESEKSHTVVEIEKLIENFVESTTGIARKISSDKFMVVVEERYLSQMIKSKFPILDKAREIQVGERGHLTISIGVGHCSKNLSESEKYARQGLDMCLGRGGDQVAVKTDNGFEFFGGVSTGMEKQTKVKTRIIANAISDLISTNGTVFVMGHKNGDMDSIGSATGLCAAVRSMGNEAYVVVERERNLARSLIDYVEKNDSPDMYITPTQALMKMDDTSIVIVVDTHNPDFLDSYEVYRAAKKVVVIDHHRKMVKHIDDAVIFFHEPQASSVSEMVAELVQYLGDKVKLTACQAEALLAGIMLDTKNFVMRTGARTFEAAAYLRLAGADTVSVKKLFSNSIDTYQQKSMLITNCEVYERCAIATARATSQAMRVAAPQAADELLGINGVDASFVLYEEGGTINVSARSMGKFNVQVIMEALGGGGHATMAGAQLKSTLTNVKQMVFQAIDEHLDNLARNKTKSKK